MTDTFVLKIDSNSTGLKYCEEDRTLPIGTLPVTASDQFWYSLEPNSYTDFGAPTKTVARQPINVSRQIRKGTLTDLDPAGGFQNDLTQDGLTRLLQGFFFANLRESFDTAPYNGTVSTVSSVVASSHEYVSSDFAGTLPVADALIAGFNFANSANNGLHVVSSASTTDIVVAAASTADETAPASARLIVVGQQGASADFAIVQPGAGVGFPSLTSIALDFTTLPVDAVIPGAWMWIGGDSAGTEFATAANNGWARIRSVAAHAITFDKTSNEMVADAGTGKTVQIFWGKVLRNEPVEADQVRRTYHFERTLGQPDLSDPTAPQAEYLVGAVPNEMTFNMATAEKITLDLTNLACDYDTIDVTGTILSQVSDVNNPVLASEDAFNTTSDVARAKMTILTANDASPSTLFAEITEFKFMVKNNLKGNKALGKLGPFEITAGFFEGSGSVQAYFNQVAALAAVRANADVSIDFALAKNNQGMIADLCLLTLQTKGLDVKINEPIMLPIDMTLGADRNFNHTLLMSFFDFLPDAAMPA